MKPTGGKFKGAENSVHFRDSKSSPLTYIMRQCPCHLIITVHMNPNSEQMWAIWSARQSHSLSLLLFQRSEQVTLTDTLERQVCRRNKGGEIISLHHPYCPRVGLNLILCSHPIICASCLLPLSFLVFLHPPPFLELITEPPRINGCREDIVYSKW